MFIVLPCIVLKIDIHRHTGYEANVLKKKKQRTKTTTTTEQNKQAKDLLTSFFFNWQLQMFVMTVYGI